MPSQNCGNCNFQGDHGPKRIYCYYWREWRVKGENDNCEKRQKFSEQNKNMRLQLATEERKGDEESQKSDSVAMNDNLFGNVILDKVQQDFLCTIVEAERNLPSDKRKEFNIFKSKDGCSLTPWIT